MNCQQCSYSKTSLDPLLLDAKGGGNVYFYLHIQVVDTWFHLYLLKVVGKSPKILPNDGAKW